LLRAENCRGDEEAVDALRQVLPDEALDVSGLRFARFAPLQLLMGAERALEGQPPASERRHVATVALHEGPWAGTDGRSSEAGQVVDEV